jgi:hypothetical protein
VEALHLAGAVPPVPNVVEPDLLAVRGVEERAAPAAEVEAAPGQAAGAALGVGEDVLGPTSAPWLRRSDDPVAAPQGVIGWPVPPCSSRPRGSSMNAKDSVN